MHMCVEEADLVTRVGRKAVHVNLEEFQKESLDPKTNKYDILLMPSVMPTEAWQIMYLQVYIRRERRAIGIRVCIRAKQAG
jgi:hypothetical protein